MQRCKLTDRNTRASTAQAPIADSGLSVYAPLRDGLRTWASPQRIVAMGLIAFAMAWLSHLSYVSLSPPGDNIEQLTWVRSLEWGYYKHPPLPTWLLWLPVQLFGAKSSTTYVLGAALTLSAMGVFWRLLAQMRGSTYACVALLGALCITYYNGRLYYYNHNIVLLLASTASAALCWQAFATRRLRWWVGLGIVLGLGALAKYQIAVTLLSVLAFWIHQRGWRDPVHRLGGLLACLVALSIFVPHLLWLRTHDFGPVQYAIESSLGARFDSATRMFESIHWLADQLFNRALPAWLLLVVAAVASRRMQSSTTTALTPPVGAEGASRDRSARALLLAWGVGPLLFMTLIGLFAGADLQLHWGTPFLLFAVPAAMEMATREFWERTALRTVLTAFLAIQALLLLVSHLTSPLGPERLRDHHWRNFDAHEMATRIAPKARAELGGPIRVVIGNASQAGLLALSLPEHPLVLIDGRFDRSPWVTPERLQRCGAVELGAIGTLPDGHAVGAPFPGLAWRTIARMPSAAPCPD